MLNLNIMTTEEKIEIFVQGTKNSFNQMVSEGTIDLFSIGRKIHFLVEKDGVGGMTTPFDLPISDPIKGIILVSFITNHLEEEGCEILCGCEIVFNVDKLHLRFSSEVTGYDEIYEIDIDIKPQSVTDTLIQMGMSYN